MKPPFASLSEELAALRQWRTQTAAQIEAKRIDRRYVRTVDKLRIMECQCLNYIAELTAIMDDL